MAEANLRITINPSDLESVKLWAAAMAAEIESLRTRVAKIRALHRLEVFSTTPYCAECHDYDGNDVAYPCRTIAALDAPLVGEGKPE